MAHKLADETLAAILAQHLAVPDAAFASTDRRSPFARIEVSTSALLVVCKRWMRVATPLLYETVILRSTAQAAALAVVLKANKDFGRFIKKLRVEGGFGQGVQKIISASPNITDFCMTLHLWADDNVKGMCAAMPSMNPRRLVIISLNSGMRNNASTRLATQTLCDCIASWSKLQTLVVPCLLSRDTSPEVLDAIEGCKTLQFISLTGDSPPLRISSLLNKLAANPTVTSIQAGWTERSMENTGDDLLSIFGAVAPGSQDALASLSSEAKAKVKYASGDEVPTRRSLFFRERRSPAVSLPLDPSYRPLSNASDAMRVAIWTRVMEFVIADTTPRSALMHPLYSLFNLGFGAGDYSDDDFDDSDDFDSDSDDGFAHYLGLPSAPQRKRHFGPAVTCMLVCKEFKAIATRVACQHLTIYTLGAVNDFAQLLAREPELAGETKSVTFFSFRDPVVIADGRVLSGVLRKLTALRDVSCVFNSRVDVCHLSALAEGSGRTLTTAAMECISASGPGKIAMLGGFSALTSLHWEGSAIFEAVKDGDGISLPSLTKLTLGPAEYNPSFLAALSHCQLPQLETLDFHTPIRDGFQSTTSTGSAIGEFFAAHGDKVRVVIGGPSYLELLLTGCPRLREYHFGTRTEYAPPIKNLAHKTLEVFKLPHQERRTWDSFFINLSSQRFPALHTLKVPNKNFWPATQREISKSVWPPIAERLLESGIKMQDGEGIAWRPRLQTASTRRK
ncbi:hypothetical protein AURDEDRAFT_188726 [Auricularia subglabra TFB-10046 SS5]|uniref:Uncharacterized protein n=1 Tax=Auricularia subglabra (strain TFB-10046 / SS5) TaxID=717982 RepID=J0WRU8_AURST|nr:hypothetical protein AURDEDRAFT_188726 [Auricularia subglabra TFB-10046 SS5]